MIGPIELEIFKGLLSAIPEEMGIRLRRSSFSPNIKERLDFSCALFDAEAHMIAQAAHIPVHLGAMPLSVQACVDALQLGPGDVAILNDPFKGGTHLPDITLVTPIFVDGVERPFGYVASRAHHADVGGIAPGSMPLSTSVGQEGVLIPPSKIVESGELNQSLWDHILSQVRTPQERNGDLRAQLAANRTGVDRTLALLERYTAETIDLAANALLDYTERITRSTLAAIPDGSYRFSQFMDDDGQSDESVEIQVVIEIAGDHARVDFSGTAGQRPGNINAVLAITVSAVWYVFRCLLDLDVPNTSGSLRPIEIVAPEGSLVNARYPAAVAAGNVETSQRIVDCLFGALAQALPDRIPAASQGTMNNLTIGGMDLERGVPFTYYETVAGGAGASPDHDGATAIHTHMTNTLNTPVEALEFAYPLRVRRYSIRRNSGGTGTHKGGDGLIREIELLAPATVSLLTERRKHAPYGLAGGAAGAPGHNLLIRTVSRHGTSDGKLTPKESSPGPPNPLLTAEPNPPPDPADELPGKISFPGEAGDVIRIETPGGGGYGEVATGE